MRPHFRRPNGRALAAAVLGAAAFTAAACSTDQILSVATPDIIDPAAVNSAPGAEALRVGALGRLNIATSGGESFFLYGGLLADEFKSSDTFQQRDETDQRSIQYNNANINTAIRDIQRARVSALQAEISLKQYKPAPAWETGEMLWVQGYTENMMGENLCSGVAFSFPKPDGTTDFGTPQTTAQVYARALSHLDSALAVTTATSTDDQRVTNLAKVTRGRLLLNQGQFAQAALAVANVPTTFVYFEEHSLTTRSNQIWSLNTSAGRYTVADIDGGNGLNFVTAGDPRVTTKALGNGFDGRTPLFGEQMYARTDPFPIVTGIEARLIEAEAALKAGDVPTFIAKLNDPRAAVKYSWLPAYSGLPALVDPGTPTARENLLFRERAFWLFASGHRLGDLRRLVRQYGRGAETVFPTGTFHKGGTHGPDVNLPVTQAEENNPNFHGCLDRSA